MLSFYDILTADEAELLQEFYRIKDGGESFQKRQATIAKHYRLRPQQFVCALGFNPASRYVTEILPLLGFATYNELIQERNDIFGSDIYKVLSLDNILKIYEVVRTDAGLLEIMQYLLKNRLLNIEDRIEETVNSLLIEKYKTEMRAVYSQGIAGIDFAEDRLNRHDSGFRALLNEVNIIVDCKLIPAGEIFFRDNILPQEKQKLLNKGIIPEELVVSRLNNEATPPEEKKILYDHIKAIRQSKSDR